jgi:hypothetical protein
MRLVDRLRVTELTAWPTRRGWIAVFGIPLQQPLPFEEAADTPATDYSILIQA